MHSTGTRKASDSIVCAMVSLIDTVNGLCMINLEKARSIFVPDRKNRLNVALAMPCAIFTSIHQKLPRAEIIPFPGPEPRGFQLNMINVACISMTMCLNRYGNIFLQAMGCCTGCNADKIMARFTGVLWVQGCTLFC